MTIYDLIFVFVLLIHLPVYILRRKFHSGFMNRLGVVPVAVAFMDRPIWVHAVSVGEAMAARGLVDALRLAYPGTKFVISTVTPTGNAIARGMAADGDVVTYLPFDFSWIVRRVIRRVKPAVFIIVETELWPNLIMTLKDEAVPVITVNGRISARSFRGYRAVSPLVKPVLQALSCMCVQTPEDAGRATELGISPDKVHVTGNLKFDAVGVQARAGEGRELAKCAALGLKPGQPLIVAGSTHPGEEELLMRAFLKIRSQVCGARMLIAPRHPDRCSAIIKMVRRFDFDAIRVSTLPSPAVVTGRRVIYLLDSVGQLMRFYAFADVVFVGGSMVNKGGHNILEPASLGKPVVTGEHMSNFKDIAGLFARHHALRMVHDIEGLQRVMIELLQNPDEAARLGAAARELITVNSGATERTVGLIRECLKKGPSGGA